MIDPVHFYALYGPGMVFSLALGRDGVFAYSLAGNMGPFFPLRLIGEWEGSDPVNVAPLRQRALELSRITPANAPSLPDSAFISIGQVQDGAMKGGEYALYDPPEKIASLLKEVLNLVKGGWLSEAVKAISANCRLRSAKPPVSAEIVIESVGKKEVHFTNPLRANVLKAILLDPLTDLTVEPRASEMRVSSSGRDTNNPIMKLASGDQLSLALDILTDIPAGSWELHLSMELTGGNPGTDDLVEGVISWEPFKVVAATS